MEITSIIGSPGYPMTGGSRVCRLGTAQLRQGALEFIAPPAVARIITTQPTNVDLSIGFSPSVQERSP